MDAVAYMGWKRIVPWKILSMPVGADGCLKPVGFGARHPAFAENLRNGGTIWVVTRVAGHRSLAAKVCVSEVLERGKKPRAGLHEGVVALLGTWRYVATARRDRSAFYETNNAKPVLDELGIRFSQSRPIHYREECLEGAFAACVQQARKLAFLSYRWKEARRFALAVARELRAAGLSPWIDALSIPAYTNEPELRGIDRAVAERRLDTMLQLGISASSCAVVFNTCSFKCGTWTKRELRHIRAARIPWVQVLRGGSRLTCDEPPISARMQQEAAREIVERCSRACSAPRAS